MIKKQFTLLGTALLLTSSIFTACKNNDTTDNKASSSTTVSNTGTGEAIDLKFNLPEGAKYELKNDITQSMSLPQGKVSNKMDIDFTYTVLGKEAALTKVQVSYDRIKMKMTGAGMPEMEMDTDKGDDPGTLELKKMIGHALTMKVSPEGKVSDIEGWEQMFANGSGKTQMKMDDLVQSMELSMNIYPSKPVRVGDTWTINTTQNLNAFSMAVKNTYTLSEVSNNVATLNLISEITPSDKASNDPAVAALKMGISGTQTGIYKVDINTGMIKEGKIQQKMKAVSGQENNKMSMDIESEIELEAKPKP